MTSKKVMADIIKEQRITNSLLENLLRQVEKMRVMDAMQASHVSVGRRPPEPKGSTGDNIIQEQPRKQQQSVLTPEQMIEILKNAIDGKNHLR